ncbi:MAG: Fic family protein [Bacteroidota bacterium]
MKQLTLLRQTYFEQYKKLLTVNLEIQFADLPEKNEETKDFDFYLASASTYSSNIEGNAVDFDTYFKSKTFKLDLKRKEIEEIDDLIEAYTFAQNNKISFENLLKTHSIFAKRIISNKNEVGTIRSSKVGVGSAGKLIYLAIDPEFVEDELYKLVNDINVLLNEKISMDEVFYFASMIHLIFVNIHPFVDGNGRATRLLEKWFLASKLGKKAWNIESEKNYFLNRSNYYRNLKLGGNYYVINYDLSLPFLLLLPESLKK